MGRRGSAVWVWRACRFCGVRFSCIGGLPASRDSVCLRCFADRAESAGGRVMARGGT
jgi:hypothetical protein